jgi:hypothetical protein
MLYRLVNLIQKHVYRYNAKVLVSKQKQIIGQHFV